MPSSLTFPNWWLALSAVPPSKTARDWWAPEDARSPRYDRLYRVWGDPTDGVPPPYYKVEKEKHLVPTLWENFAIFRPADTVAALYGELQFEVRGRATDLCWSYEFNLGHQDRQLDIVMHVRFAERDEVVICEAKAGRKRFDDKDIAPHDVLSREVFRSTGTRRYFLLGDALLPGDWHTRGYRHLTWRRLYAVQWALCETLPETGVVRELVRRLIGAQFAGHGIATDLIPQDMSVAELGSEARCVLKHTATEQCRNFVSCAVQHVRCLHGVSTGVTPIDYLLMEPGIGQIRRHWRPGCGGRSVNERAYWRLPPR